MSDKNERRLKLAAQGLRKTALSLQAAVVSLLQAAEALTAETDDNLVDNSPLDANLQDLLKGNINGVLNKLFGGAFNNEGETLDKDQKTQQSTNGAKRPTRKPRPPRDPNAPTKPQNAFILFQKDVSNQVKAENQGKPWSEIVHLISTRWKALPKEEKEVYEHQYELAKQRFEIEYKAYMDSKDQEAASSVADANGHESNNTSDAATQSSLSSPASSEDDEPKSNLPTKSSKKKLNVHTRETSRFKKRKSHDDDDNDNESVHEEEEIEKPRKKKKESDEIHEKDQKKVKKNSREVDEEGGSDREEEGKKRKKNKKKSKNY